MGWHQWAVALTHRLVSAAAGAMLMLAANISGCDGARLSAPDTSETGASAVASVVVTPASLMVKVSQTMQLSATLRNAQGEVISGRAVAWTSSSDHIATVSSSGVVTGIAPGVATISATATGKTGSATLTVTTAGSGSCNLVGGTTAVSASPLAKPGYLESTTDPDFGTTITRITGDPGTPIPVVGGTWGNTVYADYPKDAVWNADQSLLLLKHAANRQGAFLFLDGTTYRVQFGRRGPSGVDARWHPTMPDIMLSVHEDGSVSQWNARTDASTWKLRSSGYSAASFGGFEGNPSLDGRYLVVQATRNADGHLVAFAVDVDAGIKFPDIDLTAEHVDPIDWASISALGNYVVVFGRIDGREQRTKVFTRSGSPVGYWTDYRFGHYDLGADAGGNELAFGAVSGSTDSKQFIARRLDDGTVTVLTVPTTFDWHSSVRNIARLGWGYAVTNDAGGPYGGEIYAVKLDGSGLSGSGIERFAHHRSTVTDYEASPMPVPSPDGRRVLFNSNWGDPSGRPMQVYIVDTRQLCPDGLPQ